jgi:hypothetical protein
MERKIKMTDEQKDALHKACEYITNVFFAQERIVEFDTVYFAYCSVVKRNQLNEKTFLSIYNDIKEICNNRRKWN